MFKDDHQASAAEAPKAPRRVYIAGPMTGIDQFNYPAFNAAAAQLRAKGWLVENPADHGFIEGAQWADYMRLDLPILAGCDAVYLLPGWANSRGAKLEYAIATSLGLGIIPAPGAEPCPRDLQRAVLCISAPPELH